MTQKANLWNLISDAKSVAKWGTIFRLATSIGIIFTWAKARENKEV